MINLKDLENILNKALEKETPESLYFFVKSNHIRELINAINEFENLKKNWDGYGGSKISKGVRKNAVSFVEYIPKVYYSEIWDIEVSPNPNSTITIYIWLKNKHNIEADIGINTMSVIIGIDGIYKGFSKVKINRNHIETIFKLAL